MHPKKIALFGECMLELSGTAFGAMQQRYGGDTFNTAVYLARCGGPAIQVCYATAVGNDTLSTAMLARWQQDGIGLELVRTIAGRMPGIYQIEVDAQGERRFHFWRENSAARAYFDTPQTPLEARAHTWDAFYFSGISLAILPSAGSERLFALAHQLRARGASVVFDNNYRAALWPDIAVAREQFARAFAVASTLLITADDHQALFALPDATSTIAAAQQLTVGEIIIKRGAAATLVRAESGAWEEVAVVPVTQVVDTTAAGDSFAAGYLSQRLLGAPRTTAAHFGNTLAARVIGHPGAIIPLSAMADLPAAFTIAATALVTNARKPASADY